MVERRPASLVAVRVARDAVGTAEDAPEVPPVVIAEPPKRPISPRLSSVVSGDPTGDVPSAARAHPPGHHSLRDLRPRTPASSLTRNAVKPRVQFDPT